MGQVPLCPLTARKLSSHSLPSSASGGLTAIQLLALPPSSVLGGLTEHPQVDIPGPLPSEKGQTSRVFVDLTSKMKKLRP